MFVAPPAVARVAEKALAARRVYRRGGTLVGVRRAVQLSTRSPVSLDTVRRMVSYFARHAVDKRSPAFYGGAGFPSAGRIAWDLWGGEPGRRWALAIWRRYR